MWEHNLSFYFAFAALLGTNNKNIIIIFLRSVGVPEGVKKLGKRKAS